MAQPNLSEIVTTTLRNRSATLADNVTRNNALLNRLKEKGNIEKVDGGRTIVRELEYAQNATAQWYSGYQTLNVGQSQVFSAAEFNLRQAAVAVVMSGLEQLQNDGKERVINLLKARIKNAERTMENLIAAAVYSDGTNSLQPGGLKFLVADAPTAGVVGGISRATWAFWQNQSFSATTTYGATAGAGIGGGPFTPANIQSMMNQSFTKLVRGRDKPDLILADQNAYNAYLASLQAIQRVSDDRKAQIGFTSLKYMDADVVLDGGFQGFTSDVNPGIAGCPANHMYFLNTDFLFFQPHKRCNMDVLGNGDRFSTNQDAIVRLIGWAGNMTISNSFLQGVLTA